MLELDYQKAKIAFNKSFAKYYYLLNKGAMKEDGQ